MFEKKLSRLIETTNQLVSDEKSDVNEDSLSANQRLIYKSWKGLKFKENTILKTAIYETIPLLYALVGRNGMSYDVMVKKLNQKYDWNPRAQQWLLNMLDTIKGDNEAYKTFLQVVVGGTIDVSKPGLESINKNTNIRGFIHGSIKKFYAALKETAEHKEGSKDFTADVILIWGDNAATAYQLTNPSGGLLNNFTVGDDSLIRLADGKTTLACVSLKVVGGGRIGKSKGSFMPRFYDSGKNESVEQSVDEGLADSIKSAYQTLKGLPGKISSKAQKLYNQFKNWVGGIVVSVRGIFSPTNPIVVDAKRKNDELFSDTSELSKHFDSLVEGYSSTGGKKLNEITEMTPVEITDCFRKDILGWFSKLQSQINQYNAMFEDFGRKIITYNKGVIFRMKFNTLNTEHENYKKAMSDIQSIITRVQNAKIGARVPASGFGKWKKSGQSKCNYLVEGDGVLRLTRKDLRPILMHDGNYIAIQVINGMITEFIEKAKTKDTQEIIKNLIQFSTEINTDAIFGSAMDIPLILYNGSEVKYLGTRRNFEKTHTDTLLTHFKSAQNLPVIGVNVSPSMRRNRQYAAFYEVVLYSLSDYTAPVDGGKVTNANFTYNVFKMRCNSGSSFAFSIESEYTTTGDKVLSIVGGTPEVG